MNRYFTTFIATALLYTTLFGAFLYTYEEPVVLNKNAKQSVDNVKFTVVSKEKETIKELVETVKKPIKKVEKKQVEKPKELVETVKKPKKEIVKKKLPKVKKIIKKKEVEIKKTVQKKVKQQTKQNKIVKNENKQNDDENNKQEKIDDYYSQIKKMISQNKKYPKIAIRRGIEGSVKVQFTISSHGELVDFKIVEGKRVFKKSIKEVIEKTFPLAPPQGVFVDNLELSLTIEYKLYS
ncbi:MAG: energy transducer TonB [Campylobacterota bacterium]|nr:energy transducer TonB [Campylobacterota bacterium]